MFGSIIDWIKRIFGIKTTVTTTLQQSENNGYAAAYEDITKQNFTAIFAERLAALAVEDSALVISEDNKRAAVLADIAGRVWSKMQKITAEALGVGGVLLVPYVSEGTLFYDVVRQDRLVIHNKIGEKIINATILAEKITVNTDTYYRWANYLIDNNVLTISNRITTEQGKAVILPGYEDLQDIRIANVDKMPFGFIKCPKDDRKGNESFYGVPVTYGCNSIITELHNCISQISDEFDLKQVRIYADDMAIKKDKDGKRVIDSKLFFKGFEGFEGLFEVFDPAIRETAYYTHFEKLCERLEASVGTSKGILTKQVTHGATASEIKEIQHDTFSFVKGIHEAIKAGMIDFLHACDVLCNYYNLSPVGDYSAKYDWSYAMLESSTETWQHRAELQARGALSLAELRASELGETLEEAQEAVDRIKETEPTLNTLLGGD